MEREIFHRWVLNILSWNRYVIKILKNFNPLSLLKKFKRMLQNSSICCKLFMLWIHLESNILYLLISNVLKERKIELESEIFDTCVILNKSCIMFFFFLITRVHVFCVLYLIYYRKDAHSSGWILKYRQCLMFDT